MFTEAADCAYMTADFKRMDLLIDEIHENAQHLMDKVKPFEIRINARKAENNLLAAVHTGLDLLELLGEKFPKNPG